MNYKKSTDKKVRSFYELANIIHQSTIIADKMPVLLRIQKVLSIFSFNCPKIKFDSGLIIN